MTARKTSAMVLPPHETIDGEIRQDWLSQDVRVPRAIRETSEDGWRDEHPPRVAGHSPYVDDRCYDGRHLFDVIESTHHRYVETDDGDEEELVDFRARLTCVRCGKVLSWEGTRSEEDTHRLDPVPLAAGDLMAQHVKPDRGMFGARDMSTWHVYRDGQQVGKITWGCGPRGRAFYSGWLDVDGVKVEAKDPVGVLRKLARPRAATA